MLKKLPKTIKSYIAIFLIIIGLKVNSQNTYYYVHNAVAGPVGANQFTKDQVNATNTGAGTAYWKHFSTVSGGTLTTQLVPGSTPITANDNIIFDNNSIPTHTAVQNYVINIDNTGAGLICQDFDASAFNPPAGQLQRLGITIVTQIQCYRHFRLSPSNRFMYLNGTTLTFPNNLSTAVDSIHFYGTRQANGNTFRYQSIGNLNINSNGKVYFCDTVNLTGGNIVVRANDNIGTTNETHFLENIWKGGSSVLSIRAGNVYIHKNVNYINEIRVGQDFLGSNSAGPVTANARIYTHAPGYYSSPGVWNSGLWTDPGVNIASFVPYLHSTRNQNSITQIAFFSAYRGIIDVTNTSFNETSFYLLYGVRGSGLIGNAGIDFITNINTFAHFSNRSIYGYHGPNSNVGVERGFKLRGTYIFEDANNVGIAPITNALQGRFSRDTIVDTILVRNNIINLGLPIGSTVANSGKLNIAPTGYARFYSGYNYNFGCSYITAPLAQIYNEGKFIMGDTLGCSAGSKITKCNLLNLVMAATGTQTIGNTQIENSQIVGTAAQRTIHYSNTDMGGNNNLIFKLYTGQNTSNGIVPSNGNYAYGTAPYNVIPFTGNRPRTLHWNNLISGGGTNNYWTQNIWYNEADGDGVYNDCPPTFIDSVIVEPGTTLRIDQRFTQCKSFVCLAGAPITLAQRAAPLAGATLQDSLSTLEVYGNFHLNQQINNMLNRNIVFKAWQTYPTIRTSNTKFWRGLFFRAINTATNSPTSETNPGAWTLLDDLNAYNQNITFSPRPNSAAGCSVINFTAVTNPILDASGGWWQATNSNDAVQNHIIQIHSGNFYTNNKTISSYNFYISPRSATKNIYLGSSVINIYGNQEYSNVLSTSQALNYGAMFVGADMATRARVYPGTSHIKLHCKGYFTTPAVGIVTNITTNSFGNKGQNYYDVSFLQNDTLAYAYYYTGIQAPIGAGVTRSGIYQSLNCNYHNITYWNNDPSLPHLRTFRDTINKVIIKRNTGSMNSGQIQTIQPSEFSGYTPPTITQINSSIDSLIFETKLNNICTQNVSGNLNIKRYLYFSPGSTNAFFPGARHIIYNNASTVLSSAQGGEPWVDLTPSIPSWFPTYVAPSAKPSYTWAPWGAKVKSRTACDNTTIIKFGGLKNAGNAVAYPTPYHWSGAAPRDTFDIDNVTIIDDSLTQFQTVNPNTLLSGSTLNWDVPVGSTRNLVFRDGGVTNSSWFDKSKWATITFTASPNYTVVSNQQVAINYTVGAVGECPPVCGDVVLFDNASFTTPTNTVDLGSSNSAYAGTIIWNQGVAGVLGGTSNSVLNICNSLYFSKAMTNSFLGQTVFSAIDSSKVEYIQSGDKFFNNQILFNQRNPSKYKTAWKLLDSLRTFPIANAIVPAVKINKGTLDTRGQKLTLLGGIDLNSSQQRGLLLRNSKLYLTGGRSGVVVSGNGVAFYLEGDFNKLKLSADSSDIVTESVGAWSADFKTWSGAGSSQVYVNARKGYKFNKIELRSMTSTGGSYSNLYLRSDTITSLKLYGRVFFPYFYKGYIKKFILDAPTTVPGSANIGNLQPVSSPLYRFKGQMDTARISHRFATACPVNWDTLYVKDEFTVLPGTSLLMGQGGLTWFANTCNTQIVGTAALPVALSPGAGVVGTTYNYPSGNRAQNEHYFRKDSGIVCTDYAQLYNIWAIGNGNGNNSCTGGAPWGCNTAVATNTAYGTWMSPIMTPTTSIRTLADTSFYSSETPNPPTSGRARFMGGSNADFGWPNPVGTHNCAGWDPTPSAVFPNTQLTLSQYTVCPGATVTASLTLVGSLSGKDFPITVTYSVGGVAGVYSFTSSANNPYTFTFTPTANTNTSVTWVNMSNQRCFNNVQAVNTTSLLTILPSPTLTATQSGTVACAGAITTLSASGATTYTWSTSQNSSSITVSPTVTTTYSVVGTNTLGCFNIPPITLTVNVNALPTMSVGAQTNVACFGGSTGAVTLTPTGGSGSGYTITPTTTVNLAAGSYTYNVKDGANCTSTIVPITITQPTAALTAITSNTANTDCITPNGIANVIGSGGTSAYTYSWSTGATTSTINSLTGGTYSVTVIDNNNCTYTTQATISNPSGPVITASSNTNTICSGNNITITPSGGTTYTIIPSIGTSTVVSGATIFTPTATISYSVIGTNATSCLSNTVNFNVTVNATPVVTIAATSNTICNGQSTTLNLSGANTYTLLNTGATITSGTIFSPTANTTYSIQGTSAAGCTGLSTQQLITVNALPSVSISATSASICAGSTATLTASGANSYTWTSGPVSTTYTTATAGVYTVTGRNTTTGCTNTQTVNVAVNALPSLSISATSSSVCAGNTATYTATGANTYSWTSGPATATYTTATAGTYTVSGTDGNGCVNTKTVSLAVSALPIVTIAATSNTICNGQSTTLNLTGASTYTLVNTGTTITSGTVFTPTTNTTYSIQGTSAVGCVGSNTQQLITVNALPTVSLSATTQTLCSGQTATLTASGAASYTWTSPSVTTPTNAVSPTANTTYSVIGTSTANCNSVQQTIAITVNQTPTVSIASVSSPTICSGNTTTITPNGANTYTLTSSTQTLTVSPFIVNPTTNTTYSLTGLSTLNCASANMINTIITVNQTPTVAIASVSSSTICSGNTTTITPNGASTYTLTSSSQTLTTSPFVVSPTVNTTYTLVGTSALNCPASNTANTTINVNTTPTVGISSSTTSICSGNTVTLTASGATTYTWTNPSNTNTVITVSPASTQVYTLQGSSLNCSSSIQTVTLTVNQLPTITASTITNVTCFGANNGNVIFTPAAGTPTYAILGTGVTGTSATGLSPANYTYTVTDAAGCSNTVTLTITQPTAALTANAAVTATNSSCTSPNGVFAITATGGTSTYSYSVDGGALTTNSVTTNLSSGTHSYVVTDSKGCTTTTGTVNISGTPGITSSVSNKLDVLCYGNNTASVSVTGAGGSTYNYTLTPITATTSAQSNTSGNFTGLSSGTYSVLVKDQISNCISTNTITINTPTAALALTGITANSVVCNGGTAQVTASVTGGTIPYSYVWSAANTSTTSTATYTAGNYSVNINDANGCILTTQNFTVAQAPVLTIASVATTTTGCGLSNGTATVNVTGGWNSSYTYSLNSVSQSTNTVNALIAGTYTTDVMDALGCTTQTVFTISNPTTPTLNIASSTPAICAGNTATLTPSGAMSYTLASPSTTFATNTTVNPTVTTVYSITGTDASNCTSAPLSVTVTVNELPKLSLASSNAAICVGQTSTLTANTTGTTSIDTYTWSTGVTTVNTTTVSPSAQTVYTVVGTNAATGCVSAVQSVTVNVNQLPTITASTITNVTCFGLNNGSIDFVNTLGTPNYTVTGINVSGNSATGLAPTNYTYTVTDAAGCVNTTTVAITQPTAALLTTAAETATNTSCTSPDGVATLTITGGTSGYTINPSSGVVSGNTITGLNTGAYTFTVTDANGCTSVNSVTITGATGITSTLTAQSNVLCFGNNTASVSISGANEASGTYNYSLTPITGTTSATSNTTGNFTGLSAGTYSVLVTGGVSNCISSQNISITEPSSVLALTGVTANSVICNGGTAVASATVSGGTIPYTYLWSSNTSTLSSATYTAGNYSVDITDANGCALATQNFTINEAPVLTITSVATTTTGCGSASGTATINVNGGWNTLYTYSLNTVSQPTNTIGSLAAGTYTADVADALGCTTQTVFTISNPFTPTLSIASNPSAICAGQSVTLTPTGAVSYTLDGTTTFTNNVVLTPGATTVVTITGTDASSCTSAPLTVTVNVNALPTISVAATSTALCSGNTATLTAGGASSYVWTSGPSTATYVVSSAGTYSVVGTDITTGCSSPEASITITVSSTPTVAVASQTNVLCFGNNNGSVDITTNATTPIITPATTGLSAGVYTFTITDNASSCSNTVAATITGPTSALTASVVNTTTNTSCATPNGAFTVTANGGTVDYNYTSASTTNTTGVFVNQGTGNHNIIVTDFNGCTYTGSATIPGIATPSISATTQTNVLCNGGTTGSASISITGGTPNYTYTWSNNAGLNSNTQANLPVGPYTVTATDAGSCTVTQAFVITEPSALNVITTNTIAPCVGQTNGSASIEISGGTPSYNVAWNPTSTVDNTTNTSTISNIGEGNYMATVTDANGCNYQYPVTIKSEDGIGCTFVIPEIFSPNGDSKNDTWEIKGLENYPNNNVTVFNRWGDQVFKAEPYKNDWDGTNTGDKSILGKGALPVGTYYFILDLGNGDKPITGYVQLTK